MANELGDGPTSGDVPETHSAVPGGREGEAGVTGELDLADEVRVASHHLLGLTPGLVLILIAHWVESPLDQSLVTRAREKELLSLTVDFFLTHGQGSNPSTMTYSTQNATNLVSIQRS